MMQKEYWVNVYEFGPNSFGYGSELCLNSSNYMIEKGGSRVLYRIHVKMDGGYNKRKVKPLMKIFGVEVPGVHYGDGALKGDVIMWK